MNSIFRGCILLLIADKQINCTNSDKEEYLAPFETKNLAFTPSTEVKGKQYNIDNDSHNIADKGILHRGFIFLTNPDLQNEELYQTQFKNEKAFADFETDLEPEEQTFKSVKSEIVFVFLKKFLFAFLMSYLLFKIYNKQ